MTKAALIMMTQSYAVELGPKGVRVNAIAPGFTLSERIAAQGGPIKMSLQMSHTTRVDPPESADSRLEPNDRGGL